MALKLMGKKRGMTQLFDDKGNIVVCTVIEVEPNVITQIKTKENDGYNAIQLGFGKIKVKDPRTVEKRASKPLRGHYAKANTDVRKHLLESRLDSTEGYALGQELNVSLLADETYVDATAVSKGKGFQGVIKLHNYSGGPAAHGSSFHRHAGSTGMRSTPGRCLPGGKRASHMGHEKMTIQNIRVVEVNTEDHLLIVAGSIPGPRNGLVYLSPAKKMQGRKKKK